MSSPKKCLLYLVYGAETYHQEAFFSVVSALSLLRRARESLEIQVVTDCPDAYHGLPVTVRTLDSETRARWSQPSGYHFRMKHALLRDVLETCETAVLVDSDTFFRRSPLLLPERVAPGHLLCHAIEGVPRGDAAAPGRALIESIWAAEGVTTRESVLLNSGVIGLHASDRGILDRSIALMDRFSRMAREVYILEQLCLSIVAHEKMETRQCEDVVFHYWSRKDIFRAKIAAWLGKHRHAPFSENALDDIAMVSEKLPRPDFLYRMKVKIATRFLPDTMRQFAKELSYGCYPYPNAFDRASGPCWWKNAAENAIARGKSRNREEILAWLETPRLRWLIGPRISEIHDFLRHDRGHEEQVAS
ncbi:MAG: hypothetical protein LBO79_10340 [Zoogloeaceae bacterium]|jgi:hypothetical protein|nr:hypothetical protein [Zoogloeaceae bacterium]